MRSLFFILFCSLFCGFVMAQENQPRPAKDAAFLLDQTSPQKAIELLGQPETDKTETIDALYIGRWIDEKFKKSKSRVLVFKQFENLGKVKLTFFDEKLVAINFLLEKEVPAARLSAIYKVQFIPIFNDYGVKESVGEFDKLPRNVSVVQFPRNYYLVGTGETSVIAAKIFSGGELAQNIQKGNSGAKNENRTTPISGKAVEIQILSRTILK